MINKEVTDRVLKRITRLNSKLNADQMIDVGFAEGRGFYFRLPDCFFSKDRNIIDRKHFINVKTYTDIGFLLNRYEVSINRERPVSDSFTEMFARWEDLLNDGATVNVNLLSSEDADYFTKNKLLNMFANKWL